MYFVYILQSQKTDYIYTGSTDNLERRIEEHNSGERTAAGRYKPLKLVYYEAYLDKKDALDRERKLKHHGSAIGHLKKELKIVY
ncbi:MAG: GIY-YIG nuclease family protein [Candidatus Tantalella remota]|nr:GIY-YIG nuclease family protein [Candidatus Tantalella remota]